MEYGTTQCSTRKSGDFLRLAFMVLWTLLGAPRDSPAESVLRPGEPIERELEAGESHTYQVDLAAGGRWWLEIGQRDIDVIVVVSGPRGESLVAVDSPFDRQGQEAALLEAEVAGVYRIEIRSREATAATGRYEIRIDSLDPLRLAAAEATTEGARLYLEGTKEAWRRALAAYSRAFEAWHGLGENRAAAGALYSRAVLHRLLEENRRALELDREVLPLWQRHGDRIFAANTWNEIGLNQWHLGETPEARSSFSRALELHREAGHRWGEAVASANLCLMELVAGNLRAGARCYERAIPFLDQVRAVDLAGTASSNAGRAYDLLGEPEEALTSYRKALQRARVLGDRVKEARSLNNLGVLHRQMDEFQEALSSFDEALATFQESGSRRWQAHVLNNVGVAYRNLGQLEQAHVHFRQALALWRGLERPRGEAATLVNLGLVHRRLQRPREARDFFRQALTSWRAIGDRREEALALAHLGRVAMDLEDLATAADLLGQGASILRQLGDQLHEAEALRDLGVTYNSLGQLGRARECLGRALRLVRDLGYRSSEARVLVVLARTERLEGAADRARGHVEEALRIFESERTQIRPPTLRASFASTFYELYELAIDLLVEAGDTRTALEVSERARARTLFELLQEPGAGAYEDGDPDLLDRRRSLQRRLDAKAERAARPETEASRQAALAEEQAAILRELDVVETELRRNQPENTVPGQRPAVTPEIQALLDGDSVLLAFALGEARSFLWRVDLGAVTVHELPPRREIEEAARRVHEGLRSFDPAARRRDAEAAAELARLLLGPVAGRLEARNLVIMPDGALFYVPFEALPLPAAADARVNVLERHEVVYLPSASVLATQRRTLADRPRTPHTLAVLADPVFDSRDPRLGGSTNAGDSTETGDSTKTRDRRPRFERLPATRLEAQAVAALAAPEEVLAAFDFEASRQRVLGKSLQPYRFVHFATHGVIDTQTPALSGLVLSLFDREGQPREGFLRLHDIYGLRLDAELVVLSGCRTALGRQMRGEGLWGLTQGFLSAGARRVVASLWQVEDRAAAELMRRFYTAMWLDGLTPAAALRSAKLSLRRERRWRDPYFWAGFVLEGDWR